MKRLLQIIMTIVSVLLAACSEDTDFSVNPSLRLEFSRDTIAFDTLFTTVGSPTAGIVVRNRNSSALRISSVRLGSGGDSGFSVLVDGQYGAVMNDLEIRAKDSIFLYAAVELERNGADVPLMVKDSLVFTLESGVQQQVTLLAYGRDVTFLRGEVVDVDRRLSSGHYVVYDSLVVAPDATLAVDKGTTLYFHDKAFMRVDGTLEACGTLEQPVVMRGDRTDNMFSYLPYDRVPGQWGGVVFSSTSNGNVLSHCDIHSANYGVIVEAGDTTVQRISIESSKLCNFKGNALELNMSRASVNNSLIANAKGNCVKVVGGAVSFVHCTIANFYIWEQRDVALALHNSHEGAPAPLRGALFANCVISGSRADEVMGYLTSLGDTVPDCINYRFENSLINTVVTEDSCFVNVSFDNTPNGKEYFRVIDHSTFYYDFHLRPDSLNLQMAIGRGADEYIESLPYDLDGVARVAGAVDAGCYQYVEETEK